MNAIESTECQTSSHLGEALARKTFATGENMLQYLHANNLMRKVPVTDILLTPTPGTKVSLREVNNIINGKPNDELDSTTAKGNPQITDAVTQAKQLLEQAIKLDPSLVGQVIQAPTAAVVKKPRRRQPRKA